MGTSKQEAQRGTDVAWSARVSGASWAECATIAGYSDAAAACAAVRKWYGSLPTVEHEDQRNLWRTRLEALWAQAMRDVADRQSGAITAAVRVGGLAVQLDGLAAPQKLSLSAESSLDSLISALSAPVVQGEVVETPARVGSRSRGAARRGVAGLRRGMGVAGWRRERYPRT